MGQVFTWDAVRDWRIPIDLSIFSKVIEDISDQLFGRPFILGLIVCGSVLRGDHTIRSDIDCFILYDHRFEHAAFKYMQEAIEDAAAQDVPLSFIPCDSLLANTRMHHVGDSFLLHLERSVSAGGLIKGNPLQMLAQSNSMEEELESYLRTKMYNLQEAWAQSGTFSDERMASFLKKLLEAPMHVARKTLARHIPLGADSKAYVQTTYAENMPLSMVIQLQRLVSLDQEYTELLQKQSMFRNETEYRAFLQKILAHTEDVLAFIRSNLAHVAATAR